MLYATLMSERPSPTPEQLKCASNLSQRARREIREDTVDPRRNRYLELLASGESLSTPEEVRYTISTLHFPQNLLE